MRNTVMKSLFLLVVLALCASAASAGCGEKAVQVQVGLQMIGEIIQHSFDSGLVGKAARGS